MKDNRTFITAIDDFVNAAQRLKEALINGGSQLALPLGESRATTLEVLRPKRRKKHAKYGLIKLKTIRSRYGLNCSVKELEQACDRLGLFHQNFCGETYIHYWNAETLKRYYANGN